MSFLFNRIIICFVLSFLAISSVAKNSSSVQCQQSCSGSRVAYPFGFSDGCEIKLNCSHGIGKIGNFLVKNVTSNQILITTPADCNRSMAEFFSLFGKNFAPSSLNGFLFRDCKSPVRTDSVVSKTLANMEFNKRTCDSRGENDDGYNITCYAEVIKKSESLQEYTKKGNCSHFYSSIVVNLDGNDNSVGKSSSIKLDFEMMELNWWINGKCSCNSNADCVQEGHKRFRCECKKGYSGDGFINGTGCSKVCSSPKYLPVRCGKPRVGILVGGSFTGAFVVIVLIAVCVWTRKRRSSLKSGSFAMHLLSEAAGKSHIQFYPYKEILRATNSFSEHQRLGTGAYGTVYAGKLHEEWVAIKKLKHRDQNSIDQIMNEIKLLSSVSHPNLVRLLGCCIDNGEQILVYEFMPNGTLSQHLQRQRCCVLPWTIRLTIAAETAGAIAHLHSAINPPIYHRDIKSSNILLDYSFKSKVADFGLSRFGMNDDQSHLSTAPQGTPGYVDPQYHQNFHLSDKSDVYSFGVVLVEIITSKKVVDFSRPHSEINLAALATDRIGRGCVDDIIDPFLEPNRDAWTLSSVHKVAELAFRCLSFYKEMRPSMMEVADELEQIRLSSWAPLEENSYMGSSVVSSCSSSPHLANKKWAGENGSNHPLRIDDTLVIAERRRDSSPVSVQDPWLSEESPPTLISKEAS